MTQPQNWPSLDFASIVSLQTITNFNSPNNLKSVSNDEGLLVSRIQEKYCELFIFLIPLLPDDLVLLHQTPKSRKENQMIRKDGKHRTIGTQ